MSYAEQYACLPGVVDSRVHPQSSGGMSHEVFQCQRRFKLRYNFKRFHTSLPPRSRLHTRACIAPGEPNQRFAIPSALSSSIGLPSRSKYALNMARKFWHNEARFTFNFCTMVGINSSTGCPDSITWSKSSSTTPLRMWCNLL